MTMHLYGVHCHSLLLNIIGQMFLEFDVPNFTLMMFLDGTTILNLFSDKTILEQTMAESFPNSDYEHATFIFPDNSSLIIGEHSLTFDTPFSANIVSILNRNYTGIYHFKCQKENHNHQNNITNIAFPHYLISLPQNPLIKHLNIHLKSNCYSLFTDSYNRYKVNSCLLRL